MEISVSGDIGLPSIIAGPYMAKVTVREGPLSSQMYCAIGMVAVAWAHLEDVISLCLSRLLGADHPEFLPVAANMPSKARLDSVKALAGYKLPSKDGALIIALCDEAAMLSRERNKILHSSWLQGETPEIGIRFTYRAHGRVSADAPTISAHEIAIIAEKIGKLTTGFTVLLEKLGLYDPTNPMKAPIKS